MTLKERFFKKVRFNEKSCCWEWIGSKNWFGYGMISINNKLFYAHRVSYELFNGTILRELVIDHLCKNRSCVNPEHLEAVTRSTNTKRGTGFAGKNKKINFCPKGHELNENNLNKFDLKRGKRSCKKCHNVKEKTRKFRESITVDWQS